MATPVRRKDTGPNPKRRRRSLPTNSRATVPGDRWRARVKVMGVELFLGTFDTKEEAEAKEQEYRDWRREQQIKQGVAHA